MKYKIEEWLINDLISLFEDQKLNLNPPYQRNDIWPTLTKKRLIESIKKGYPLPSFFLHKKGSSIYDMVDGQQRTRTFIGYKKGFFPDLEKKDFSEDDNKIYNEYKLAVVIITTIDNEASSVEDFYYRVNKFGIKLNRPEIKKAEYFSTAFQELIERIAADPKFEKLNLFSEQSTSRLNDLDFVAEILTLLQLGITDKKIAVDKLYESNLSENALSVLEISFYHILEKISLLSSVYPLEETRYKQRNDFYTLISFLNKHTDIDTNTLVYQYKTLVLIGKDIYPSNEKCWPLQEYANNCVSQSNSKKAREERLLFFEHILLNQESQPIQKNIEPDNTYDDIVDVMNFYGLNEKSLFKLDDYYLLNNELLNNQNSEITFLPQ